MAKKNRRQRNSGSVRKLPSGRWQARLLNDEGLHVSLGSYATKTDAGHALTAAGADQIRGSWVDPRAGRVTFEAYAADWLENRSSIRPRTRELYESQLRLHILPTFGAEELVTLTTPVVRRWHARLVAAGKPGPVTVAKVYRLLRTILNTAVEDGVVAKNPCTIKGAGTEHSPERPVATIEQVYDIAAAVDPRHRMLVLLATFTSLRLGELAALTRRHIDVETGLITVTKAASELRDGTRVVGEPKTFAGRRTVAIPPALVPELREHLEHFSRPGRDGLVFVGPLGGPLRRGNWSNTWRRAVTEVGVEDLHFHDLRHTGNTLAAATGASTKELMNRMGHSSARAALLYQHATHARELVIAYKLSDMIAAVQTGDRLGEPDDSSDSR